VKNDVGDAERSGLKEGNAKKREKNAKSAKKGSVPWAVLCFCLSFSKSAIVSVLRIQAGLEFNRLIFPASAIRLLPVTSPDIFSQLPFGVFPCI
jgi:hypothetical protein